MQFFIFVLLVCFFVFMYCAYTLSNDDFIFFRKDISMERIFNLIFIGAFFSLFFSRMFYGITDSNIFSNPFVFLLFTYFPGLSLLGAVVGGGAYLAYAKFTKDRQFPLARIADFLSIAFLLSLSIGFIGLSIFSAKTIMFKYVIEAGVYFVLFIIFLRFLLPWLLSGKIREGTISFIFLLSFALVSLISNIFPKFEYLKYFKNWENIVFFAILIMSAIMIAKLRKGKQ
jgi:hypothetical protein